MKQKKTVPHHIAFRKVPKTLLFVNMSVSLIYLSWWFQLENIGSLVLYGLLLFGELYHVFGAILFWLTVWPVKQIDPKVIPDNSYTPSVDVFITVAGEPLEIVRKTAKAARDMNYPNHEVYILNDGYVAKKENWRDIVKLADELGINVITRQRAGGAKAGNINNALTRTKGEFVLIFDADMVPHTDFLAKTIPYFKKSKTGFVQTPQYYENHSENRVSSAAWDQQELFFGPIMQGKSNYNAAFICGTNVVIRRSSLIGAGGMVEDNIAEDFLTSLYIHSNNWQSYYRNEVLAEGLGPTDLLSYFKQQLRWARGSLEVLFGDNPFLKRGLSFFQRLQYFSSGLFYMNGLIVLIDMVMPLIFFFTGVSAVATNTINFAFFFVPYIFLNLYTLSIVSDSRQTFKAVSFVHSSFYLQLLALKAVIFREKTAFSVTPKSAQTGNFLFLAYPHIIYFFLTIVGFFVAAYREGITPSVITNLSWAMFNVVLFMPYIITAINPYYQNTEDAPTDNYNLNTLKTGDQTKVEGQV